MPTTNLGLTTSAALHAIINDTTNIGGRIFPTHSDRQRQLVPHFWPYVYDCFGAFALEAFTLGLPFADC